MIQKFDAVVVAPSLVLSVRRGPFFQVTSPLGMHKEQSPEVGDN
jgi:hypothetical protein